jgi:hypothetical protein
MSRPIVIDADAARADLGAPRSLPQWREGRTALPFHELTPDEFEVFCFLLLLRASRTAYQRGTGGKRGADPIPLCPRFWPFAVVRTRQIYELTDANTSSQLHRRNSRGRTIRVELPAALSSWLGRGGRLVGSNGWFELMRQTNASRA